MSDQEEAYDEGSESSAKKGKKVYYPFGTPTHNSVPYSKFAHLNNPQTQEFATQLSSSATTLQVREPEPEKPKKAPKKAGSKSVPSASVAQEPAANTIPDAEGLEPCTKIACQLVIRSIADLQVRNEIERDEIEDEYDRLLQDLAAAEQEIQAAEAKLVTLNDIGSQLEVRSNQLREQVDSLQSTKDSQDTERNDVNGKLMILQTEKNKRARALDKAMKALSDATWRKKKQEQQEHADAGLSLASSEISDKPIRHTDASTVSSLGSIYKTSYNQLAAERVRDVIELPPAVKTLPPFMVDMMAQPAEVQALDKYAQRHYKRAMEHNVKSWEGMDGSLITASIFSASAQGFGPEVVAKSFDQYNRIRASRGTASSVSTAVSSRVGTILQSRNGVPGGSVSSPSGAEMGASSSQLDMLSHLIRSRSNSPAGSRRSKATVQTSKTRSKSNAGKAGSNRQIRLAPLDKAVSEALLAGGAGPTVAHGGLGVGETGLDSTDASAFGFGEEGDGLQHSIMSVSAVSGLSLDSHLQHGSLSPHSLSMSMSMSDFNPFGETPSVTTAARRLDPVFYKDQSRYHFARKHAVGKLRKADITWGMKSYVDPNKMGDGGDEEDELDATSSNKLKASSVKRMGAFPGGASMSHKSGNTGNNSRASTASAAAFKALLAAPPSEPTVKSRSLTVYHPSMQVFRDSASLSKKDAAAV